MRASRHRGHYPSTLLVKRKDGPAWVARVFSSPADKVSRVEDDADILRFLASHDFPAERLAHDEPVSVLDGGGVIVTEFVEGGRPTDALGRVESPAVHYELASLLGRLHTLPAAGGRRGREGWRVGGTRRRLLRGATEAGSRGGDELPGERGGRGRS